MSRANRGSHWRMGQTAAHTMTTWGHGTAGACLSPQTPAHDTAVRQDHPRQLRRPSCPTPSCIIAPPQPWLAVCNARVAGPTHPTHPHPCGPRDRHRGRAPGGLQRPRLDVSTPHQPPVRTGPGVPPSPPRRGANAATIGPGRPCSSGGPRPRRAAPSPPPEPSAPLGHPPPGAPAAGGGPAHATTGWGWLGAPARPASCGGRRQQTTGPAPPSHHPGSPPQASSATTPRHRQAWVCMRAARSAWAHAGVVVTVRSEGLPHGGAVLPRRRRCATPRAQTTGAPATWSPDGGHNPPTRLRGSGPAGPAPRRTDAAPHPTGGLASENRCRRPSALQPWRPSPSPLRARADAAVAHPATSLRGETPAGPVRQWGRRRRWPAPPARSTGVATAPAPLGERGAPLPVVPVAAPADCRWHARPRHASTRGAIAWSATSIGGAVAIRSVLLPSFHPWCLGNMTPPFKSSL